MKLLTCPLNGPRNIAEFQYLGPWRPMPGEDTDDRAWARALFAAPNHRGPLIEWWRHTPSNYVFLAERDIGSGDVLRTFDPKEHNT